MSFFENEMIEPDYTVNREISLLRFQERVLEEALDPNNLILERIKFLAILGSNMDEFFMVRYSGLKKQVEMNIQEKAIDGKLPSEILADVRKKSHLIFESTLNHFHRKLLPGLNKNGVHLLDYEKLSATQRLKVDEYFKQTIFPVLTPLAIDPGHPFPHISNISLNFFIVLTDPKGKQRFARLKIPPTLPRLIPIKRSSGGVRKDGTVPHHHYFVWIEQVIRGNLSRLFRGMTVNAVYPFRIIRDADLEIQELEADDLLANMESNIRKRKFGSVVIVEVEQNMPANVREILIENLEIKPFDLVEIQTPFGLSSLWQLYEQVNRHDLKEVSYIPKLRKPLKKLDKPAEFFEIIKKQDILLHHPYDSFLPVVDMLNIAARDPQVLAIKQTLYRVGSNAPVVEALLGAAERGKQVAVLLELKARFDEESNIGWAKKLEQAGVHVVYGLVGLKTHSKIAMVVRQEEDGIRRYLHLATGNYNVTTARLYEDIGMFTCDPVMGEELSELFNELTGYSRGSEYRKLLVAPRFMRQGIEGLIVRETELAQSGNGGRLIFKMNAITDPMIIKLLYEASNAGVQIDLLVRGICCLLPGVKGVSENIRVTSILGRYLEHSRIFYFQNGGAEEIYVGSADLMPRNLDHRVEVVFPVGDPKLVRHLKEVVLDNYLRDNTSARIMQPDGTTIRLTPAKGEKPFNIQQFLMSI